MKSPYTGKEMKRVTEKRIWNFRGEEYTYYHTSWYCEDTEKYFTTEDSDNAAFMQVTNQYRSEYGIPYIDEIINIRKCYGISASKMSLILGLGTNQYRLYEQGEVPSVSNGRMIKSIEDPNVMLGFINSSKNKLSDKEYNSFVKRINTEISKREEHKYEKYDVKRIFNTSRGKENGYAPISIDHLKSILLYILNKCGETWQTKMNKLLFYIDFLSYRERGMAMTGLTYKAIQYGPVPVRWDRVYSQFQEIEQQIRECERYSGNILVTETKYDENELSESDIKILDTVCSKFQATTSKNISDLSHNEKAWKEHINSDQLIPFDEAFSLNIF